MDSLPSATSVSIALVGSGGAGVMTAGQILLEAAAASGLYGLMTRSTGPQIRGGEAAALLRIAAVPVESHGDRFDILLALDWTNVMRFAAEIPLDAQSLIIADPGAGEIPPALAESGARIGHVALGKIAKSIPSGRAAMVALGALGRVIGLSPESIVIAVKKAIGKKRPEALAASAEAVCQGSRAATDLPTVQGITLPATPPVDRWLISGNEATGYGALKGGIRFVAAYPITPATEILEWMAPALQRCGGVLMQAEDELASINMIIGASYGGAPALTATSGPGLSLMIESLGLAVASEVPIVVVDVMRGGPSTGIPTKSEQTDLNIAVYGMHGDAPHVVLAPLSVRDCLFTAQWAVHLAESMQVPAIVLSDQFLGQARAVIDKPAEIAFLTRRLTAEAPLDKYQRYAVTAGGVSPMALPGVPGGQYTAEGLEHSPRGTPSSRVEDHKAQLDKRQRKVELFDYGRHWAEIEGADNEDVAVITWGSSAAPVREAIRHSRIMGAKVRFMALRLIAPAQPEQFASALTGVRRAIVFEQSHMGQFYRYLRAHYDLPNETIPIHRPGPLPLRPGEIRDAILTVAGS